MKIPQSMYSELGIYDILDLEKYLKAVLDEINSRNKYDKEQIELIYTMREIKNTDERIEKISVKLDDFDFKRKNIVYKISEKDFQNLKKEMKWNENNKTTD